MDKTTSILGPNGRPVSSVSEHAIVRNDFSLSSFINDGLSPDRPGGRKINSIDSLAHNLRYYLFSNFRQVLAQAYVEIGLFATIVDVPVDDALRGGVDIKTSELDESEILELHSFMEECGDIEVVGEAAKWARCFGGGAIIPIIEDQDPEKPFDLDSIDEKTDIELRAVDLWELFATLQNVDGYDKYDPDPSINAMNFEYFMYYGQKLHKSRVMKVPGRRAPSWIRPRLRGWGLSEIEACVRSFNQYIKNSNVIFELVDEAKLDVYKLKGLAALLQTPEGEALAARRVRMANGKKDYLTATALDSEDEFEQRTLTFSGMADVQAGARSQVAADLRMPITKIFGTSAAGFNSGEDDIEVYNGMIESSIRPRVKPHIMKIVKIRCKQLFGVIPDDLKVNLKSLRILSAVDEETVKSSKHTRLLAARQANEITRLEYRDGVNKGQLLDVSLDTTTDELNPDDPMVKDLLEDDGKQDQLPVPGQKALPGKAPAAGKKQENETKQAPTKPIKNSAGISLEAEFLGYEGPRIVSVGVLCNGDLLCGRRRDNQLWTSPGGHIEKGEIPEEGAIREVLEEAGIRLHPSDLQKIGVEKVTSHRTGKEFMVCCYIAELDKKPQFVGGMDPDHEVEEWKWVPVSEDSPELAPGARHAKHDSILSFLFGIKNAGVMNPGKVDEALWSKAKRASEKAFGRVKWAFVTYWYKKHGGKFA